MVIEEKIIPEILSAIGESSVSIALSKFIVRLYNKNTYLGNNVAICFLNIRQEYVFYVMVNSIKELANRDDAKDRKIKALEKRNAELEARLLKNEKQLTK